MILWLQELHNIPILLYMGEVWHLGETRCALPVWCGSLAYAYLAAWTESGIQGL